MPNASSVRRSRGVTSHATRVCASAIAGPGRERVEQRGGDVGDRDGDRRTLATALADLLGPEGLLAKSVIGSTGEELQKNFGPVLEVIINGRYGWLLTAAVSVGVPLVFFLVFERWFLVPLPKGPLEAMFGFG